MSQRVNHKHQQGAWGWVQGAATACLALGLLLWPRMAAAELPPHELQPEKESVHPRVKARPCDQVYTSRVWLVDFTRESLEEMLCRTALWLDGVGGPEGDVLAARDTRGRLELSYYQSEFGGAETRVRLKVRVQLPGLKQRLSAFFGLDNDQEFIEGRSEGFGLRSEFPSLSDEDDWLAGLGYRFPGSHNFTSEFQVGARGLQDTEVFVRNRFRLLAYADYSNLLSLREILFWTNAEGFGATTGIEFMHVINNDLLLRWDNVGTVSESRLGLDWRSALILYQQTGKERGLAYQLFARGESRHVVPLREYGARLLYRFPVLGQRLFIELVSGYTWPKIDPAADREGSFGAGIGVELPFGPREP